MNQLDVIKKFVDGAKYYMVVFENKEDEEFGKILDRNELPNIDLLNHEIHRSIDYTNDDMLFVFDLQTINEKTVDNPLQLLLNNLEGARLVELVYPNIFRWAYDGFSIKAYAIIPSGNQSQHSTITRYGGSAMFCKILKQHLKNISRMKRGVTPDYEFLQGNAELPELELSLGSINIKTHMYSVGITLDMTYLDIIKRSKNNIHSWKPITILDMKYWSKEINPDFITEAKHIKLTRSLSIDDAYQYYPPCIKRIMGLPYKGNYNRFLLARFLLSTHKQQDAKFIYMSILGKEEKEHVTSGECSGQWNYIMNNLSRYLCPTCRSLRKYCTGECNLVHPLELVQERINQLENEVINVKGD